jgi:hypothetical protein
MRMEHKTQSHCVQRLCRIVGTLLHLNSHFRAIINVSLELVVPNLYVEWS